MRFELMEGLLLDHLKLKSVEDKTANESVLQIEINNVPFSITMRTPGEDEALIRGLLFNEDIYTSKEPLRILFEEKNKITRIARIKIAPDFLGSGYLNNRSLLSVTACGICGKKELDLESDYKNSIQDDFSLDAQTVQLLFESMREDQILFNHTGGVHAAAVFDSDGKKMITHEDIGRHNAVDKVIGTLLNNKKLSNAKVMTVSGRVSFEIVAKTFRAGIPVLASVSAPSSLAISYCKQLGITLLAFCRQGKFTCYAHPNRLIIHP